MKRRNSSFGYNDLAGGGMTSPRGRPQGGASPVSFWFLVLICIVLGLMATHQYFAKAETVGEIATLKALNEKTRSDGEDTVKKMNERIQELTTDKEEIERKLETEKMEKDQITGRMKSFEQKLLGMNQESDKLRKETSASVEKERKMWKEQARKMAVQRWGEGKVYVDFETKYGSFRLEMAPFDLLPHATTWFLNLAETGYWERCGFVRNANHVLQANCNPKKKGPNKNRESMSILFQEYSDKYPHKKFTFGIAGRPGGPDWYINLQDNVKNHGPGGQGPEADPCFARLIAGDDVILEMKKAPREASGFQAFIEPVIFTAVKVLTEEEELMELNSHLRPHVVEDFSR